MNSEENDPLSPRGWLRWIIRRAARLRAETPTEEEIERIMSEMGW